MKTFEFTSQLFFDDALIREIHTSRDPYAVRGAPQLSNDEDPIFGEEGRRLILSLSADGDRGFGASMTMGLAGLPSTA